MNHCKINEKIYIKKGLYYNAYSTTNSVSFCVHFAAGTMGTNVNINPWNIKKNFYVW